MTKEEAIKQSLALINNSKIMMVGSIDEDGFPCIKAVTKMEAEGLNRFWISTNTSSQHVRQLRKNPRACLYFVDQEHFQGLTLTGTMEILEDSESKRRLWREGCEMYYPQGVDDPDYCVLRFTARKGRYYYALSKVTFEV